MQPGKCASAYLLYSYQYWNSGINGTNTSLFINLVDDFNQFGRPFFGFGNGVVNDQVTGYTLPFLESNVLPYTGTGTAAFNQRLIDTEPVGITDAKMDLLLSFY